MCSPSRSPLPPPSPSHLHSFLSKSKHLLISWLQSLSAVILGTKRGKRQLEFHLGSNLGSLVYQENTGTSKCNFVVLESSCYSVSDGAYLPTWWVSLSPEAPWDLLRPSASYTRPSHTHQFQPPEYQLPPQEARPSACLAKDQLHLPMFPE